MENILDKKQIEICHEIHRRLSMDQGVLVSMPTGSGKTFVGIGAALMSFTGTERCKALMVVTNNTLMQWIDAIKTLSSKDTVVQFPTCAKKWRTFVMNEMSYFQNNLFVVINKETFARCYEDLKTIRWSCVVVDEIHDHLSPKRRDSQGLLSIPCKKIGLSATLTNSNALVDLEYLCRLVDPRFVVPVAAPDGSKAPEMLNMRSKYVMSYTKQELDLETKQILRETIYVSMDEDEFNYYLARLEDAKGAHQMLCSVMTTNNMAERGKFEAQYQAALRKLRIASICYHLHEAKKVTEKGSREEVSRVLKGVQLTARLRRAIEIMEQYHDRGEALIVFSEYAMVLRILSAQFSRPHSMITGETKNRSETINAWAESKTEFVFLATTGVASKGVNGFEKKASTVLFIETNPNPTTERQALGRIDRRTQRAAVLKELRLAVPGSIDCQRFSSHEAKMMNLDMTNGLRDEAPDVPKVHHIISHFEGVYSHWMQLLAKTTPTYQRATRESDSKTLGSLTDVVLAFRRRKSKKRKRGQSDDSVQEANPQDVVEESPMYSFDYKLWLKEQVVTPEVCREMLEYEQQYFRRTFKLPGGAADS